MLKLRTTLRSLAAFAAIAMLFAASSSLAQTASHIKKPVIYQVGEYLHINAGGTRPLLQAVEAVQEKYGWAVDYEDPQYPQAPDNPTNRISPPHRLHSYATNGDANDSFSLQYKLGANPNSPPGEAKLLWALVDAFNQNASTAQFKLLQQENNRFAVVGVEVRGANEQMVAQQPLLDLPIALMPERRSAADAIAAICRELSQDSKLPVAPHVSANLSGTVVLGGSAQPARELLFQVLAATASEAYWQLLYDAQGESYELNIKAISH